MVSDIVRGVRGRINGHAKVVGGVAGGTVLLTIIGVLGKPWFDGVTHAAAQMPVIEAWQEEHGRWSLETLQELKDTIQRNAETAYNERQIIRTHMDQRFEDKLSFDKDKWDDQRQWNDTILGLMMKMDGKLDRVIDGNR